jgi:hypothetical protein
MAGCSCLHFATANSCSAPVLSILLEHHAAGAHEPDVAGYLPLHYLALRCGFAHRGGNAQDSDASQREQAEQDDLLALRVGFPAEWTSMPRAPHHLSTSASSLTPAVQVSESRQ